MMQGTKIVIHSFWVTLAAGLILIGLFALDSLYTLLVVPMAVVYFGFNENKAMASLDYSPGQWSEAYWERAKTTLPKKFP